MWMKNNPTDLEIKYRLLSEDFDNAQLKIAGLQRMLSDNIKFNDGKSEQYEAEVNKYKRLYAAELDRRIALTEKLAKVISREDYEDKEVGARE